MYRLLKKRLLFERKRGQETLLFDFNAKGDRV